MKFSASALAVASIAVSINAQQLGAPYGLTPPGGSPAGCVATGAGWYEVQNVQVMSKRDVLQPRFVDCNAGVSPLLVRVDNGVLHDSHGRIGEIVANRQFQFDGPPAQAGTIYDAGWSVCSNGSLAIGPTTVFWQCLSGSFSNVYDQKIAPYCKLISQELLQCAPGTGPAYTAEPSTGGTTSIVSSVSAASTTASSSMAMSNSTMTSAAAITTTSVVVSSSAAASPTAASNVTTTPAVSSTSTKAPLPTGAASQFVASGAVAAVGALAAFFL